jgi:hypothetical protein
MDVTRTGGVTPSLETRFRVAETANGASIGRVGAGSFWRVVLAAGWDLRAISPPLPEKKLVSQRFEIYVRKIAIKRLRAQPAILISRHATNICAQTLPANSGAHTPAGDAS